MAYQSPKVGTRVFDLFSESRQILDPSWKISTLTPRSFCTSTPVRWKPLLCECLPPFCFWMKGGSSPSLCFLRSPCLCRSRRRKRVTLVVNTLARAARTQRRKAETVGSPRLHLISQNGPRTQPHIMCSWVRFYIPVITFPPATNPNIFSAPQ